MEYMQHRTGLKNVGDDEPLNVFPALVNRFPTELLRDSIDLRQGDPLPL